MVARYRIGANVKIIDIILKEEAIIQGTKWTKNWLDWDELPDLVVKNNPAAYVDDKGQPLANAVEVAKARLDAWRRAYPGKFPEEAWTYLKGKGPIPTPSKEMPARDLRTQPPDDSGTWIDSGTYWTHTIPPFIFAIKPDNRNPKTWGAKGGDTSYVPVEDQITKYKKENPKITDQEIEAKLRELPGPGPGGKMYSNREIFDGIQAEKTVFAYNEKEKADKKADKEEAKKRRAQEKEDQKREAAAVAAAKAQFAKDGTCPIGFDINANNTGCVRDPYYDPTEPEDGKCGFGYTLDPTGETCIPITTTPVPPAKPTEVTPEELPMPPAGNVSMIWPVDDHTSISSVFGPRKGRLHQGIDIAVPYGTEVKAPEGGTILKLDIEENGAGLYIELKSTDGNRIHKFMHLSLPSTKNAKPGAIVSQGTVIAKSGGVKQAYKDTTGKMISEKDDTRAGDSTGAHLHWGVEDGGPGKYVNPSGYFK